MGFEDQVRLFQRKAEKRISVLLFRVVFAIVTRLVLRTPVDTGAARSNWNTGLNAIDSTLRDADPSGQAAIARAQATLTNAALELLSVIWISNNLPYIRALERGHSQQAPAGMVAITVAEFSAIVNTAVVQAKQEAP